MRTVAVIQARLGSTRLPRKVIADIVGEPMIRRVVERVKRMTTVSHVVVACTSSDHRSIDGAIGRLSVFVPFIDCHERDVLTRYVLAARLYRADVVVRITGDCPLLDPVLADEVVKAGGDWSKVDFATNMHPPTFPKGLACEVFPMDTLERMHRSARDPYDREHVCTYAYKTRSELFRLAPVVNPYGNDADVNWSVDTAEDLEHVRMLYERMDLANHHEIGWREILAVLRADQRIGDEMAAR